MSDSSDAWIPRKLKREHNEDVARARMVTAATTAAPLIVAAVSRAGHGPEQLRPHQLAEGIRLTRQLLSDLETTQLVLGWQRGERA